MQNDLVNIILFNYENLSYVNEKDNFNANIMYMQVF